MNHIHEQFHFDSCEHSYREAQLTVQLGQLLPSLQYYYMGFYVHSCPKMRYKAQMQPSHLLSPTLLSWHPLEACLPLLDSSKYSTFETIEAVSTSPIIPTLEVDKVKLLVNGRLVSWSEEGEGQPVPDRLSVYLKLVGQDLAERMALCWESDEETVDSEDD